MSEIKEGGVEHEREQVRLVQVQHVVRKGVKCYLNTSLSNSQYTGV